VSTVDTNHSQGWFVRAAAVIGDLSSPFYAEERERDVWNEASAVAFQVLIWLHLIAATTAVWIVGAGALPYVYALLGMIGIAGWIAILYSWSLGVHLAGRKRMSPRRLVPVVVLALLLAGGMFRAQTGRVVAGPSTLAGFVTGVAAVVAVFTVARWYARRRAAATEADDS
jgi:hypothetical protein